MMSPEKKLKFVHQMTHLALSQIPHYDQGGTVNAFGSPDSLSGPTQAAGLSGGAPNPNSGLAGTVAGFLGTNNNYQAGSANIQQGTNASQLNNAYQGVQNGLGNQAGLVQQAQPGVAQGFGTQNALAGQLAAESLGQGPNPAQAALNQSTGQNINEAAALSAGQRGAGGNAGMIAENAARQGAATQQQAVGQAATLQAQQQIAAQQQAQGLAATQIGQGASAIGSQNQAQQGEQGILQGANTSANNAAVSQQSNINNVNSNVAAGNQASAGSAIGGLLSGASSAISSLFAHGGEVRKMAQGGYMAPTPLVVNNPSGPQSFVGQYVNGGGSSGGSSGPQVEQTQLQSPDQQGYSDQAAALGSAIGNIKGSTPITDAGYQMPELGSGSIAAATAAPSLGADTSGGFGLSTSGYTGASGFSMPGGLAFGGQPGQQGVLQQAAQLAPMAMMMMSKGGKAKRMLPPMHGKNAPLHAKGGKVKADNPGEKAVSNHDDYANDKVPAELSQGEVVMDLDTLHDPGPIGKMARTVAQHIQMRNAQQKGAKRRV